MLLTEDEAKTKECRVADASAAARTALGDFVVAARATCIASGCMHWRCGEPLYDVRYQEGCPSDDPLWHRAPPTGDGVTRWRRLAATKGYCGLAGRP